MRHLFKLVFLPLIISSSIAYSASLDNYLDFYIGVDGQIRHMKFKKGFGDNLLKKSYPQGNIYAGFKLSEHAGVEFGYESTTERVCTASLETGECSAGVQVPSMFSPAVFKTKLRIKGPHFGIIWFYPMQKYPLQFIGSIGISAIKGTAERETVSLSNSPGGGKVRTMSKHKEALRFMGGVQYLSESGFGLRGSVSFIKTRKIVIKKSDDHPSIYIPMIKLKDSMVYGLGALYQF